MDNLIIDYQALKDQNLAIEEIIILLECQNDIDINLIADFVNLALKMGV